MDEPIDPVFDPPLECHACLVKSTILFSTVLPIAKNSAGKP